MTRTEKGVEEVQSLTDLIKQLWALIPGSFRLSGIAGPAVFDISNPRAVVQLNREMTMAGVGGSYPVAFIALDIKKDIFWVIYHATIRFEPSEEVVYTRSQLNDLVGDVISHLCQISTVNPEVRRNF